MEKDQVQVLTERIADLSGQVGSKEATIASLTETVKKHEKTISEATSQKEKEITSLKESLDKVTGFYNKSLQVIEGLTKNMKESAGSKAKLQLHYNKALAVAESFRGELKKVNGFYKKSLRVLESIQNDTTRTSIKRLVESELGKYAPYHRVFKKIKSIDEAKDMVKAIKESTSKDRIVTPSSLRERKSINERNEGKKSSSDSSEDKRRVNLYS